MYTIDDNTSKNNKFHLNDDDDYGINEDEHYYISRLRGHVSDDDDDSCTSTDDCQILNGSWNRLHTHEGIALSGVYYVSSTILSNNHEMDHHNTIRHWHGNIVFKPTPHPLEDTT
jgi:hypothetical protein